LADKVLSANTDSANKVQGYQSFYKTKEAEDLLEQIWVLSEKSFAENIDNDAEIAALEKTFQTRLEAYNLLVNKKYEFAQAELNGQDIKKLNNFDANIVSFSFLPNGKLVRFLFRKNKPVKIDELTVNRADLKNKIKNFRQEIISFKPFYATAQEFYQTLLPAEKELDFTKPLIIVPDEELWSVPFSALISPNQKYLIEKTDLALLPSLKSLILLDNGKSAAQTKVALFANSTAQGQSVLNSVKSEAEEIAKIYPKSSVFAESKATKEAFKQSVAESSILHVASHGLINLENPFESALILSKTDKDDGKLTVNEIIDIKIPSSLVVLSACDTSNGRILGGEGLLSLSWAFLVGGAKEVVGTQWKIEDTQSKKMMIEFHKGLKKGSNPIFSLRQAQQKALKNVAPFNHPYYWSGFVSIGSFR
jgi:CHAT domain-containing protein